MLGAGNERSQSDCEGGNRVNADSERDEMHKAGVEEKDL